MRPRKQGGAISVEPRINDRIRVPEVRLVGPNGEQVGIVRIEDALRLAVEADLDLVEVAPMAKPPVCKLMDFGKYKYEAALKERESRRNQTHTVIKEMKLRPKIDQHDYETKKGHVERFLKAGDKVKITIMFRGREQSRPELGLRLLAKLADDVAELGFVEATPKQDGRNMLMVLAPHRKKSDVVKPKAAEAGEDLLADAESACPNRCPAPNMTSGLAGRTDPPAPAGRTSRPPGRHENEEETMAKQKTHSGAKKRFKVTGSGKLMREQANRRHLLEVKSSKRTRKLASDQPVAPADVKRVKRLLGI